MTQIAALKAGIHTINKNWQLVFVQLAMLFLSGLSFFVIVGIPIAIAFIVFGLDLTEILRLKDIVSVFRGSAELLDKYFAMALIILFSLLVYLAFIIVVWLYAVGGTVGIITKSMLNEISKFSLKTFFSEGRRLFLPLSVFSSIIGIIFLIIAFSLGIMVGGASTIIDTVRSYESTFGLFISFFLSMVLMSIGIILIMLTLSVMTYGVAHLAFHHTGSIAAIKQTASYLFSKPAAIGLYTGLLLSYMLIGFIAVLIGAPLTFIPIIGPLLALPYQLLTYMLQGYLSLIVLAAVFHYYRDDYPGAPLMSTEGPDTSQQTESVPAPSPDQTAGPEEG